MNLFGILGLLLLASLCSASAGYVHSRATYYGSSDGKGTPTGACGYGEYGRYVYNGRATGVSNLWKNGTGCGACYKVWCKRPDLCDRKHGTTVVVTDYGQGDRTDFVMSKAGYSGMARRWKEKPLFDLGVVDVFFTRVPCYYPNHNVFIKVHEYSRYPNYLAITMLYVGGINDILAIEITGDQHGWKRWNRMRQAFGAVYDMPNPPKGPITLRMLVRDRHGWTKWVYPKGRIPTYWHAGATYDSKIKL